VRKKIVRERKGRRRRRRRRRRIRSLWTEDASPETFSVVSSENDFGDAPTGRPILAGPIKWLATRRSATRNQRNGG